MVLFDVSRRTGRLAAQEGKYLDVGLPLPADRPLLPTCSGNRSRERGAPRAEKGRVRRAPPARADREAASPRGAGSGGREGPHADRTKHTHADRTKQISTNEAFWSLYVLPDLSRAAAGTRRARHTGA